MTDFGVAEPAVQHGQYRSYDGHSNFPCHKGPYIDRNLSIINCYAETVHVFRNFVHVIKNRLVGAPVHVIEKTVYVHENCCSRVLRILKRYISRRLL